MLVNFFLDKLIAELKQLFEFVLKVVQMLSFVVFGLRKITVILFPYLFESPPIVILRIFPTVSSVFCPSLMSNERYHCRSMVGICLKSFPLVNLNPAEVKKEYI